jgi:hypothetical protein
MRLLSDNELKAVRPAETAAFPGPIPTQSVSSDEFMPAPQTENQRRVEARIKELGGQLARKHGMSRRQFLTSRRKWVWQSMMNCPCSDAARSAANSRSVASPRLTP